MACQHGGTFLLRIEDIDQSRARDVWETQIYEDLKWLGVRWEEPVLRQSENLPAYRLALDKLNTLGLLYPCFCARKDIQAAVQAPQEGTEPVFGPDGIVYPGTCREAPPNAHQTSPPALRLNMQKALQILGKATLKDLFFQEIGQGRCSTITLDEKRIVSHVGDIVLARRDMGTSYHLSVVVDDAAQQITHIVRGNDLFDATQIHVILQRLLGVPTPVYCHHRLIRDDTGKRLAKRDDARAIAKYRNDGLSPQDIRTLVGLR